MKIAVFCSASADIDPDYFSQAEALGRWIGEQGHTLVFGGANLGLMECVGQAAHKAGAMTIGVVPRVLEQGGRLCTAVDVEIPCEDLTDRKQLMMAQGDAFIAMPGGLGTLDEVFTVVAMRTLNYHQKPMVLYNIKGFWQKTIELLADLQARGMIRGRWTDHIKVANTLEEVAALVE